jgi:hypothetical protein
MKADAARSYWDDWGLALLWIAMALGPVAVSLDLGAGYALVKPLCGSGHPEMLRAISLAALIVAGVGAAVGIACVARLRPAATEDGPRVIDRSLFTAIVAIGLNVICALLIASAGGARVLMSCE